jgi:hypothetical protein
MTLQLYALPLPKSRGRNGSSTKQQLAKLGTLGGGLPAVSQVSTGARDGTLSGVYNGKFANLFANEIEELASGSISSVPLFDTAAAAQFRGYYNIESAKTNPTDPRVGEYQQEYDLEITKKGTQRSQWRAVRTNTQPADNPFGSGSTPEFGLTVRARKVRWFDNDSGSLAEATSQRRVEGEHGDLFIYDASEPSFDSPVLIYDVDYEDEYPTDCVAWDTFNRPKVYVDGDDGATVGSTTVGDATVGGSSTVASQWQRVFSTDHDWRGDIVLETDRLRLTVDQPEDVLRAYRYNPGDGQYNIVQLGTSDWRLYDIDLTDVGLGRLEAQLEFYDTTAPSTRYNLDATLIRGLDDVVWTVPINEGTTPSGLIDRLDPIAATTDDVAKPTADLVEREDDVDR